MKLSWKRWLRPRYVWYRVKRLFGWRPEWEKKLMAQKFYPDRLLLDQRTYDDLMRWYNAHAHEMPITIDLDNNMKARANTFSCFGEVGIVKKKGDLS